LKKTQFRGNHWIVQYNNCSAHSKEGKLVINDSKNIERILVEAANSVGAGILKAYSYQFEPQGVTAFVAISESHLSIHTWPENNDAEFDFNTCDRKMDGKKIINYIAREIGSKNYIVRKIVRTTSGSKCFQEKTKSFP
jgi:S-adenosylmethionine decarboxylase proenzyme